MFVLSLFMMVGILFSAYSKSTKQHPSKHRKIGLHKKVAHTTRHKRKKPSPKTTVNENPMVGVSDGLDLQYRNYAAPLGEPVPLPNLNLSQLIEDSYWDKIPLEPLPSEKEALENP